MLTQPVEPGAEGSACGRRGPECLAPVGTQHVVTCTGGSRENVLICHVPGVSCCVASGIAGWQDVAPHVDLRADGSGEKAGSALPSALRRFQWCVLFSSSYCEQKSNYLQLRVTVILFFPRPPHLSVFPKAITEKGSMYDELARSGYPGNRHGDGCACQRLPWNTSGQ